MIESRVRGGHPSPRTLGSVQPIIKSSKGLIATFRRGRALAILPILRHYDTGQKRRHFPSFVGERAGPFRIFGFCRKEIRETSQCRKAQRLQREYRRSK